VSRSDRSFTATVTYPSQPSTVFLAGATLNASTGNYTATLQPTAAGAASLVLAYEGSYLLGLPALFSVAPGAVQPLQSVLQLLPADVTAGNSVMAEVASKDQFGNLVCPVIACKQSNSLLKLHCSASLDLSSGCRAKVSVFEQSCRQYLLNAAHAQRPSQTHSYCFSPGAMQLSLQTV
jgi:hypothetical protein